VQKHEDAEEDSADEEDGAVGGDASKRSRAQSLKCAVLTINPAAKKKKKKKKKPKKKKPSVSTQSDPPRVPLDQLFPQGNYPVGEECDYVDGNLKRKTDEEKRHLDRMNNDFLADYRKAAEIHRQVRKWTKKEIKPGMTLTEIAEGIEDSVRALTGHDGLTEGDSLLGGMGFPCGVSLNNCAAHYSPNAGNKMGT